MLRSIRGRVTVGALLIVAIALGLGAVAAVQLLRTSLTDGVAVALEQDLDAIDDGPDRGPGPIDQVDDDVLVRVHGPQGAENDPGKDDPGGDDPGEGEGDGGSGDGAVNDEDAAALPIVPEGRTARVVVDDEPYLAASHETDRGTVTVARSLEAVDEAVAATAGLLAVAVPLVLALVGVVLWVVATRALAPVERLRSQVDAIGATELDRRVDAGGDDELGALAVTMNRMLERIEHAQKTQRRFVSDASHELRSPLATIRQHAEVAAAHPEAMPVAELSRVVLDEGARMQELVEALLLLARLDEHRVPHPAPVDLDDLAFAEAQRLRRMDVDVDASGIGPARALGAQQLLARAIRNLADNAVRHARTRVVLRSGTRDGRAFVQVEDDGSGIPPAERERVFERFTRLDEARARDDGGSGLGLAIVREVALAHGGRILLDEGEAGGARFTLELPAAS
ncbi:MULTISPECIES: sensor histidine kinase [Microbacterium]|uniref:sensor histidine kinase n=1 Tax=Microbacterium TaxID=33882 RepID=UPI00217DB461|nr:MULTISPECIES: HAMP domain-containing sensor histidine kinase [Microbacterium]